MEEQADDRCNVVYFCASAGQDITALHHYTSPPDASSNIGLAHSLDVIYQNVRALLDPDQGGFNEGGSRRMCIQYTKSSLLTSF